MHTNRLIKHLSHTDEMSPEYKDKTNDTKDVFPIIPDIKLGCAKVVGTQKWKPSPPYTPKLMEN